MLEGTNTQMDVHVMLHDTGRVETLQVSLSATVLDLKRKACEALLGSDAAHELQRAVSVGSTLGGKVLDDSAKLCDTCATAECTLLLHSHEFAPVKQPVAYPVKSVKKLVVSTCGAWCFIMTYGGEVFVYNTVTERKLTVRGYNDFVVSVCTEKWYFCHDSAIVEVDAHSGEVTRTIAPSGMKAMCVTACGRYLVSVSRVPSRKGGVVHVFCLADGLEVVSRRFDDQYLIGPNGVCVLAYSDDGIQVWGVPSLEDVAHVKIEDTDCVAISHCMQRLAVATDLTVRVLSLTTQNTLFTYTTEDDTETLEFSPNSKYLVASEFGKPACTREAETGSLCTEIECSAPWSFSPCSKVLFGCVYKKGVCVRNIA